VPRQRSSHSSVTVQFIPLEKLSLFLLITVIALITALVVPVSQSRITIANANNDDVKDMKAAESSTIRSIGNAPNADMIGTDATTISARKKEPWPIESSETADRVENVAVIDDSRIEHIDEVVSVKKDFKTADSSTMDDEAAQDGQSSASASSAPNSSITSHMQVDYHTNRFDYTSSWCPNANCEGTRLCFPCQRRWLIIVTVGRIASTTLTKMMALLPGVRMTGENYNMIGRFDNLLKASPQDMLNGTADAWFHNPIPDESWSCASQAHFTTVNPPILKNEGELLESDETTILGFKTIRLFGDDIKKNGNQQLTQNQIQRIAKEKVATLNHLFPPVSW
jgi:hypothetical protein